MKQIKIAVTGDLSLTGIFEKKVKTGAEIFSPEINAILASADYCICNLEGPVTDIVKPSDSNYYLSNPKNTIAYLTERNINVFNLANNHILDSGKQGFKDTIQALNGYLHFGAWLKNKKENHSVFLGNDLKIRLSGFTEKIKSADKEIKISTLKNLKPINKSGCNWNIIFHHGGEEYTLFPSPTKRNLLKRIQKKHNPDLIISHHSHTLQGYKKITNTTLFYSLGNFVFDIPPHKMYDYTDESAILLLTFTEKTFQFELIPIFINRENGIIEKGSCEIINRFNEISDFSDYKKKWQKDAYRTFVNRKADVTEFIAQKPLYKKNLIQLLISPSFYIKSFKILFDNNNRSLYWGSFIYRIFNKTRND